MSLVSAFPDIVKDCPPKMRNLPMIFLIKKFLECGPDSLESVLVTGGNAVSV